MKGKSSGRGRNSESGSFLGFICNLFDEHFLNNDYVWGGFCLQINIMWESDAFAEQQHSLDATFLVMTTQLYYKAKTAISQQKTHMVKPSSQSNPYNKQENTVNRCCDPCPCKHTHLYEWILVLATSHDCNHFQCVSALVQHPVCVSENKQALLQTNTKQDKTYCSHIIRI